jgi:hypothetical protein
MALENEINRLYGLPLDEFTAARDRLSRERRKAGERAEAARVKELRKPTASAWAVNQVSRRERGRMRKLLEAGARLRQAQAELLGGGTATAVQQAADAERALVTELVAKASDVLVSAGHSPSAALLQRISQTLHAAAGDDEGRALIESGRLTTDLSPAGLGPLAAPPARRGRRPREPSAPARDRRREQLHERITRLRSELRKQERAERDAEAALKHAERALDVAKGSLQRERDRADRARRKVEAAEIELAQST